MKTGQQDSSPPIAWSSDVRINSNVCIRITSLAMVVSRRYDRTFALGKIFWSFFLCRFDCVFMPAIAKQAKNRWSMILSLIRGFAISSSSSRKRENKWAGKTQKKTWGNGAVGRGKTWFCLFILVCLLRASYSVLFIFWIFSCISS